jgi:6-pyruvoyltetrahydropterin/6-carboxytetrahydropterin synthase
MVEYKITKNYHFHAAHRNGNMDNKCANLHGHTYHIQVVLDATTPLRKDGTTLPFNAIDDRLEPYFKLYDHAWIVQEDDEVYTALPDEIRSRLKVVTFDPGVATSAENLALAMFRHINSPTIGLCVETIHLKETPSSTVTYQRPLGEEKSSYDEFGVYAYAGNGEPGGDILRVWLKNFNQQAQSTNHRDSDEQ